VHITEAHIRECAQKANSYEEFIELCVHYPRAIQKPGTENGTSHLQGAGQGDGLDKFFILIHLFSPSMFLKHRMGGKRNQWRRILQTGGNPLFVSGQVEKGLNELSPLNGKFAGDCFAV
jgi:hypothetical protein